MWKWIQKLYTGPIIIIMEFNGIFAEIRKQIHITRSHPHSHAHTLGLTQPHSLMQKEYLYMHSIFTGCALLWFTLQPNRAQQWRRTCLAVIFMKIVRMNRALMTIMKNALSIPLTLSYVNKFGFTCDWAHNKCCPIWFLWCFFLLHLFFCLAG